MQVLSSADVARRLMFIRRTACARAQFSGCSSTTNTHSETGKMAVCCQNLPLSALSSRSVPSVLVGALFKKFGLFFEHTCILLLFIISVQHNGDISPARWNCLTFLLPSVLTVTVGKLSL